ncbi:MAG: DMT family transporter [Flavobacterium haoranii]
MISLLFVIIGHFAYGITNTLWYNPRNTIGTLPLIMIRSFSCFVIFLLSHLLLTHYNVIPIKAFNYQDVFSTIQICVVNYFGLFFYLQSLKHTQVSNAIGFSKIGLVLGIVVGYYFYNEPLSISKIALGMLILIGIALIEKSQKIKNEKLSRGLIYSILSRIFWATGFLFVPFINKLGVLLFCSILEAVVFIMSLLLYIFSKKEVIHVANNKIKQEILLLVLLGTIGTFSLNFAIVTTKSIFVFAFLGLIEPIVGLITSKVYHKERLNKFQFIGICLGLIASFILSLV